MSERSLLKLVDADADIDADIDINDADIDMTELSVKKSYTYN